MGSDSAETRANILRAAREVINERGYEAATFQAIAQRAGFSRPTMHYYFHTKEQVYDSLQKEAYAFVSDCIAQARREKTLLTQLGTFVAVARRMDLSDRSMMRFILASRLELHRNPGMRGANTPAAEAVLGFYGWMIDDAVARGELPEDVDASAVVNMLFAVFWGVGFFAGFVHPQETVVSIAKQLHQILTRGLLDSPPREQASPVVLGPPLPTGTCTRTETAADWPRVSRLARPDAVSDAI
ncbi:TetR/AcrR family transcriptional regulator [Mycolicibacterium sp. XJ1819]